MFFVFWYFRFGKKPILVDNFKLKIKNKREHVKLKGIENTLKIVQLGSATICSMASLSLNNLSTIKNLVANRVLVGFNNKSCFFHTTTSCLPYDNTIHFAPIFQ